MMRRSLVLGSIMATVVLLNITAEANDWETNFEKALSQAKDSQKYILLDFSGSDWCGWCMRLDKEVFRKNEFKKFAKENLICLLIDFPRRKGQSKNLKQQNAELAKKYGIRGFPTVILLSSEGELAGKTGYREGGPERYVEHLKEMIDKHKMEQKKKKGAE